MRVRRRQERQELGPGPGKALQAPEFTELALAGLELGPHGPLSPGFLLVLDAARRPWSWETRRWCGAGEHQDTLGGR